MSTNSSIEEARAKVRDPYTKPKARLKVLQKLRKDESSLASKGDRIYAETCRLESEKIMASFLSYFKK